MMEGEEMTVAVTVKRADGSIQGYSFDDGNELDIPPFAQLRGILKALRVILRVDEGESILQEAAHRMRAIDKLKDALDAANRKAAPKFSKEWKLDTEVIPPQRRLLLVKGSSGYRSSSDMPQKDQFICMAYRDEAYRPGRWITVQDDTLGDSFPEGPYYWRELGDILDG